MKKIIFVFLFLFLFLFKIISLSETNYIYYSKHNGKPLLTSNSYTYDNERDVVKLGQFTMDGINWDDVGVLLTEEKIPNSFDNINQVEPYVIINDYIQAIIERQSKVTIRYLSESNLLALCESINYTNRPIDWLELDAIGEQITATNEIAGLKLQLKVMKLYNFYKDNGGDPRQVGKNKKK